MMMTERQFGRMCRLMMRPGFAPMARAARMYSFCLMESDLAADQTRHADPVKSRPKTMKMETIFVPSFASGEPVRSST